MSSVLATGEAILEREAQRIAAEQRAEAEGRALAELRTSAPAVLELLNTVVARLAAVEATLAHVHRQVLATRYRTPVRDEIGTIVGVIDEINPPLWARPMDGGI